MSNHLVRSFTIGSHEVKMQSVKGYPPNYSIMLPDYGISESELKTISINRLKRILDDYLNFHTIK